jgi:hypothetical protein
MQSVMKTEDPLDRLWLEVINLDPNGSWLTQFTKQKSAAAHPIKGIVPAMKRVMAAMVPMEDLGRVGRDERYSSCFSVLYSMEDPGLSQRKLAGLHALLAKHHPKAKPKPAGEQVFFKSLWETIGDGEDKDGELIVEEAGKPQTDKPFGDTGQALKRLLDAGAQASDLALVACWHRYEACHQTLRILSECYKEADELSGVYESFLGADPSGKEGRPGSWPFDVKAAASAEIKRERDGQPVQKFIIKSADNFEFTPDSRYIVACGKGPLRTFNTVDGREISSTTTIKNVCAFMMAPDSKHVVSTLDTSIAISEVKTSAEIARKRTRQSARVAWTHVGILVQCGDAERLLSPEGLVPIPSPAIQSALEFGSSFHFSPDQRFLANAFVGEMHIRTWPELTPVAQWPICYIREADTWMWSPDGRFILAGTEAKSVYEASTGKLVWALEGTKFGPATYSHDGKWVVTGTHTGGLVTLWNVATQSKVREFTLKSGRCFALNASSDGKLLGAATHRQCIFWDFQELVS